MWFSSIYEFHNALVHNLLCLGVCLCCVCCFETGKCLVVARGSGKVWQIQRNGCVENPYWNCWWGTHKTCPWLARAFQQLFDPFYPQGEDLFAAAVREVKEETGVSDQSNCHFSASYMCLWCFCDDDFVDRRRVSGNSSFQVCIWHIPSSFLTFSYNPGFEILLYTVKVGRDWIWYSTWDKLLRFVC